MMLDVLCFMLNPIVLSLFGGALVYGACVPDVSQRIISSRDPLHSSILRRALSNTKSFLHESFDGSTDGLSFAVVHAASQEPIFTWNYGSLRMNETSDPTPIGTDSIFRIDSITKNVVALSALVSEADYRLASPDGMPELSLFGTQLRRIFPNYTLPKQDWENGGADITLDLLASHTAGLPREGYSNGFNQSASTDRATAAGIGAKWASATPADNLNHLRKIGLIWPVGAQVSYSNLGFNILGYAVAQFAGTPTWSEYATERILKPLNMSDSFFGPIPEQLRNRVSVPGVPNWADLIMGPGYDPAAGMWSSARDLAKYAHHTLLRDDPTLITMPLRQRWLTIRRLLRDGMQAVGLGWEVDLQDTAALETAGIFANETYYGKTGDGGGYHSYISANNALGYAIVVLKADSTAHPAAVDTKTIVMTAHGILSPAFRAAYAATLNKTYAGTYKAVGGSGSAFMRLDDSTGAIKLINMTYNDVSALERLDSLGWPENALSGPQVFSSPAGVTMHPSNLPSGVWRMAVDGGDIGCDYLDWDGYTDLQGIGIDSVVFDYSNGMPMLFYQPLNATFAKIKSS